MGRAGTAAGSAAAVCLALGDAMLLLGVVLRRLVTAGEYATPLCTRHAYACGWHAIAATVGAVNMPVRNAVWADVVLTLTCCGNKDNELERSPGASAVCPSAEVANKAHSLTAAVLLTGFNETVSY